jgi:translocation and assembly module TamA
MVAPAARPRCSAGFNDPRLNLASVVLSSAVRRRWSSAALILSACASTPEAPPESLGPEIETVEIVSSAEIDSADLTIALANHRPSGLVFRDRGHLEPLALEADRRRVESFFRQQGFFAAEVDDPEIVPAPNRARWLRRPPRPVRTAGARGPDRVIVRFKVHPGPQSYVRAVSIKGAPEEPGLDSASLEKLSGIEVGAPFRYPEYSAAKERVREHLFDSGYARAQVRGHVQVARASAEVAVEIEVNPGPLVHFGPPVFTGSTALPQSSLASRVAWSDGERFDPDRLAKTRRRIEELSLTGAVAFELDEQEESDIAPVRVTVDDALPNELRLGGGFGFSGQKYQVRGRATYTRKHFFHPLYTFRAELRPAIDYVRDNKTQPVQPSIEASSEIIRDDFLTPRLTMTLGAAFAATPYDIYSTLGPTGYLSFSRPFLDDRLFVGSRFEAHWLNLSDEGESIVGFGAYDPQAFLLALPSIAYDVRDDILSPRRGSLLRLELELGRQIADGGATWVKLVPEARGYTALFTERLIFAARLRVGAMLARTAPVPLVRRLFSGGAESQRGFGIRRLSPLATNGEGVRGPVGGEALVEASTELRLDVLKLFGNWLGVVAFLDAADVRNSFGELDLLNLHLAAGPGLRYHTPIGPIRFDLGFRLNRRSEGDPTKDGSFAFHFSLGEAF